MFLTPPFFVCSLNTREAALAGADLEEELRQDQGQGKRKAQPRGNAADEESRDVALSLHKDGGQRTKIPLNPEEERLKNERTVFVGNLPVTCDKKVSWGGGDMNLETC